MADISPMKHTRTPADVFLAIAAPSEASVRAAAADDIGASEMQHVIDEFLVNPKVVTGNVRANFAQK